MKKTTHTNLISRTNRQHQLVRWLLLLSLIFSGLLNSSYSETSAQSDGLPRGAYDVPYTRYESENGTRGGSAALRTSTNYAQTNPASEASDQKYVALPSNSSSVAWTMTNSGAGVTLRFTMPDASGGGAGLTGSLNLYVNNTMVKTINLSSYWSYQYFNLYQHDPTNFPAPLTFMRFDEVHFKLTNKLNVNDVVRIQKDNGDALEYGVDFIEVEEVPAALAQPAGYVNVTSYGAIANDGIDDQAAFDAAILAADAANTGIYIPAGTFTLANCWRVNASNIGIKGAGMWYSNIYYSTNAYFSGGMMSESTALDISDLYISTANNLRWVDGVYRVYKGFMGTYGTGSKLQRLWIEHFECGMWIGGYDVTPIVNSTNMLISHCRIRNNFADGINLCQGTNNSIIEFCSVRNNGDDGLASWAAKDMTNNVICSNLTFRNNTIENNWRAGSIGIFGGKDHYIHHNLIKDGVAGSGIRFTTEFSGFLFEQNTNTRIDENTIISCGTSTDLVDQEKGAIELYSAAGSIQNLNFNNNTIINAQRNGVIVGAGTIDKVVFNNLSINGTGLDGQSKSAFSAPYAGGYAIYCFASSGTTTFNGLTLTNINGPAGVTTYKGNAAYNLIVNTTPAVAVTSVSLAPTSATINIAATQQLTPTVLPSNATNKGVTYSSSNTSVATVSGTGLVTGVASGSATITVSTVDGAKTATCAITVGCTTPVTSVSLAPATLGLQNGSTSQLTATVNPSNACTTAVTYSSSNTAVATVSATGLVTAVSLGTATITVTSVNGAKTATCAVTVSCTVAVTSVTLPSTLTVSVGGTSALAATIVPSNACNKAVSWTSSNTARATVDATGAVKGISVGSATITVTTADGAKTATCAVTVSDAPLRGCTMPYTRYEASNTSMGNGAVHIGPAYDTKKLESEASDRKYVSLPSSGSYVQWTVTGASQNGFNLRYTLPDGATGTLGLYVNGTKVKDISLSSYWAYQYFDISPSTTGVPSNTSGGGTWEARMVFDELHFILPTALKSGDILKLQKDNSDGNAYGIDFVELETVPAQITKPANYLSIADYGAIADDNVDDAAAIRKCLDLCTPTSGYLGVYIPAGKFINSNGGGSNGNLYVANSNITIQGAGMWHTQLWFPQTSTGSAGFLMNANGVHLQDFSLNGMTDGRIAGNKALNGSLGSNSTIKNVWAEHFETGFWITSMQGSGWNVTDGLVISNCRIRNVYADGVNLAKGTSNTTVDNCSFRNCIDDAMAVWSVNFLESVPPTACHGNIFKNNTVENNLRAGGLGFFGGYGHQAFNLLIKDGLGAGVRANTQFPAYPFGTSQAEAINIHDVTIIGCGTTKNLWTYRDGAIDLELPTPTQGTGYSLQYINFNNIDVLNSQHDAIFIHSYMPSENAFVLDNITFTNVNINGTGVAKTENNGPQYFTTGAGEKGGHGIYAANYSASNVLDGWVDFSGSMSNIAGKDTAYWKTNGKFLIRISAAADVTGVTVSPTTLNLVVGATSQLTANVIPFNAANKTVSWTSLTPSVATVNSSTGLVTAISPGTATIRVTTQQGSFTANCTVTVSAAVNITATDAAAGEGGNVGVFSISAGTIASSITVNYTVSGTAASADYTSSPALSGSVTLTSAAPTATITVSPVDDASFEGTETLVVTLTAGSGYNLGGNTVATISIADNDNPPCSGSNITSTSTAITIDGTIDAAWSNASEVAINNTTIGTKPADYTGKYRALWDASKLYFLVEVGDATKVNDSGTSWWEDDVIELFIDGNNSKGATYDGQNDFQLGFRWNDAAINIGGTSVTNITGITKSMVSTASGYLLEVSIPWTTIGVTPAIGNRIGIEVEVDDDDNSGTRDSQTSAYATTTNAWSTPSVFGTGFITSCSVINVPVTSVSLSPTTATLAIGGTQQLTPTVLPTNATNKNVNYTSSNNAVATVNASGLVTAVAIGNATITVTTVDQSKTSTCAITVSAIPVTGVSLSPTTATLAIGGTQQLTPTVLPTNATNKNVTYLSSNIGVATVSTSGLVTAVATGSATITVTTVDQAKTATCAITVSSIPVTGVTLTPATATLTTAGATQQLIATVAPANATNKSVTYATSNAAAATVSASGLVTAVANGTATITVTTVDQLRTATSVITVNISSTQTPYPSVAAAIPGIVEAENFDNGGEGIAYHDNETANNGGQYRTNYGVDIEVCGEGGYNVGWINAAEWVEYTVNVATTGTYAVEVRVAGTSASTFHIEMGGVDKTGILAVPNTGGWQTWQSVTKTGISLTAGTQVMRVYMDGGNFNMNRLTFTGSVIVPVTGVSVSPTTASKAVGTTQQLTATVSPSNATDKTVTWSSSNTAVATVNASGLVTCSAAGSSIITVRTNNGGFTATSTITVTTTTVPVTGVTVSPTTASKAVGTTQQLTATVSPSNATDKTVTWSSSNTAVATVNASGLVTCSAAGSSIITVRTNNGGFTATSTITVTTTTVPVTGVSVSPTTASKAVGTTQQLTATVLPSNATDKSVTWSSSNTAVATVNASGLVTCTAAGSAIITVRTNNGGFTATSTITVTGTSLTYYRIKNRWQNTYLTDGGDRVAYSTLPGTPGLNYEWIREDVGNGQFELKNASTGEYMHIENQTGSIQCTARTSGWASSRWSTEATDNGFVRIKNVWQPAQYIHVENLTGFAQHGTINAAWMSAQWIFEAVAKTASESMASEAFAEVSFMPNPVVDELNIEFNGNSFHSVQVFDYTGKAVLTQSIRTESTDLLLDMSDLNNGLYIIRLVNNFDSQVIRVIKQ